MKPKTKIARSEGWVLIHREDAPSTKWYICWNEIFDTREKALRFAQENDWAKGYRVVEADLVTRKF